MAKEDQYLKVMGEIVQVLGDNFFRVQLNVSTKRIILAKLNGRMLKHKIRVHIGDKVETDISIYDSNMGRIIRRL